MQSSGGKKDSTYVDDVFSTYLYTGDDSSNRNINNGIDLAGEGGMVMVRPRDNTIGINVFDTARGASKRLHTDANYAESTDTSRLNQFNSNGFRVSGNYSTNGPSNYNYASWSFRKTTGFFDVVTYTGNGVDGRAIAHSLGSVPGMIIVKALNDSSPWTVYHRDIGATKYLYLNDTQAQATDEWWANTTPTASNFYVQGSRTNANTTTYVAYVFAGGESTAALARSVAFSSTGSNDGAKSLTIANSSGNDFGSGDFTMECWFKDDAGIAEHDTIFSMSGYTTSSSDDSFNCYVYNQGIKIFDRTGGGFSLRTEVANTYNKEQWVHFAWTRSGSGSNNNTIWINGMNVAQFTGTVNYASGQDFYIGGNQYNGGGTPNEYGFNGKISNVRITKGQAIYTSSFRPSYEPLTTTTGGATASNVKVICCNNSSITGSSLTSGTITSTNTPTASTDSPFDDPEGFKFGEGGDQNVVKCGGYSGDGTKNHDIYLGWEPSWIMIKCTNASENWLLFDVMRGIVTDGNNGLDAKLYPNTNGSEVTNSYNLEVTGTGFKLTQDQAHINVTNNTYIYIAIRRPDGYVGKPVEAGTDVFAMDYGNSAGTNPSYVSNFPVDFSLLRRPSTPEGWYTQSRITGTNYLFANTTNTENTSSNFVWDHNNGWRDGSAVTSYFSWMWKRHAGFDVLAYKGNDGTPIAHSLGKTPEMIWVKNRDNTDNWNVWHKDLNGGGIGAANYYLRLNTTDSEQNATNRFGGSGSLLPTSTTIFSSGVDSYQTNSSYYYYIAMLFASVDGISKVGSYTGSASSVTVSDVGFSPRFLLVKNITTGGNAALSQWNLVDTVRGFSAGNDSRLWLNDSSAPNNYNYAYPTSSGFVVTENDWKQNGATYIYYAHA